MNPLRANDIDQARRMQYAVLLNADLITLGRVEHGLVQAAAMNDHYHYGNIHELRACREMIRQVILILDGLVVDAQKAAE